MTDDEVDRLVGLIIASSANVTPWSWSSTTYNSSRRIARTVTVFHPGRRLIKKATSRAS